MKYAFIENPRPLFRVEKMCRRLGASKSGYYAWRGWKKTRRKEENEMILDKKKEAYKKSHGIYGSPRITTELHEKGIPCSKKRIARLMRVNNIMAKTRRRFKATTNSRHTLAVAPNLIQKEFSVNEAYKVWVSDITYIRLLSGFVYLAVIIDVFSRKCVGWCLDRDIDAQLTLNALGMALDNRKGMDLTGLVHHSDQGVQYASIAYTDRLKESGIQISMSRKGNPYDNAFAESFMKTLKYEEVYLNEYESFMDAHGNIERFIEDVYNRKRLHSGIGYRTPDEVEKEVV